MLTKTELMEHFDGIVTDSRLSLGRVEHHLKTIETGSYLAGGYTAITSGGSTGQRAVFVYDWDGWAVFWLSLFRGLLRAKNADPELAGRPAVMANVAAAHFSHATAAMARTFTGPQITSVRFPVTLPTEEIVTGLNSAQPDFLLAYPSALHVLAHEAVAGRLRITPRRILAGAEPLLPEIRAAAEEVWGGRSSTAGAPRRAAAPALAVTRAERISARTSSSSSQSTWTGSPRRPETDQPSSTSPTCTTAPSR